MITGDLSVVAANVAENTQVTDTNDPVLTRVVFPQCSAIAMPGDLRFSRQLLQDAAVSGISIDSLVAELVAWRVARLLDQEIAAQCIANATNITTTATAGGTAITAADLLALFATVDPQVANGTDSALIVHPTTLAKIRALADTTGRPLLTDGTWSQESSDAGLFGGTQSRTYFAPSIFGTKVVTSVNVPAMGSGVAGIGVFGAFSRAVVLRLIDCQILKLTERFADAGSVAYAAWIRADSQTADLASLALLSSHA